MGSASCVDAPSRRSYGPRPMQVGIVRGRTEPGDMTTKDIASTGREAFRSVLDLVRRRLSRQQYETWFQRASLGSWTHDTLAVGVRNRFLQDWMTTKFRSFLAQAALDATGRRVDVRFDVIPEEAPAAAALALA